MGEFTLLDFIFNVCRSVSDVLHILCYLIVVAIAIIIAIYRYDVNIYNKHFYVPFLAFLVRHNIIKLVKTGFRHRNQPTPYKIVWTAGSNRLPYIVKAIKSFFKKF